MSYCDIVDNGDGNDAHPPSVADWSSLHMSLTWLKS